MGRPPELFLLLESDRAVFWLAGAFTAVVFGVALAILSATRPGGLGSRELAGFVLGFAVYVAVYLASLELYRVIARRQ